MNHLSSNRLNFVGIIPTHIYIYNFIEKIQEIFAEIQEDMQRRAEAHGAAAKIEEMIEKKEGSRGKRMWEGESGQDDKDSMFQLVKGTINFRKLVGEEGVALAK